MTGADVKRIREALGRLLGRHVTCRDLGVALGLAPANAGDTVRSWEDGSRDVSGPAGVALCFISLATDDPRANVSAPGRKDISSIVVGMFTAGAFGMQPAG
jgi:hypothetical protein